MTSSWRQVQVPILGLNTERDPKLGPVGRLIKCDNAYMDRGGELRQRNGFTALPTKIVDTGFDTFVDQRSAPHDCSSVTAYESSLLATFRAYPGFAATRSLYEYSPALSAWTTKRMATGGATPAVSRTDVERIVEVAAAETFDRNDGIIEEGDIAIIGDVACVAYKTTQNLTPYISIKIFDLITGAILKDNRQLLSGARPRVVAVAGGATFGYFCVLYNTGANLDQVGATTYIVNQGVEAKLLSQYTNLISTTGTNGRSNYDAVVTPVASTVAIAWVNWDGVGPKYLPRWRSLNVLTGAVGAIVTGTADAGTTSVGQDSRVSWAGTDSTTTLYLFSRGSTAGLARTHVNATTLAQTSTTLLEAVSFLNSHDHAIEGYYDELKAQGYCAARNSTGAICVFKDAAENLSTAAGFVQSSMIAIRATETSPTSPYFIVNSGGDDPTAYLCRFDPDENVTIAVARFDIGSNGFAFSGGHQWTSSLAVHSTGIYALLPVVSERPAAGALYNPRVSLFLVRATMRDDYLSNTTAFASSMVLPGGIPYAWDRDDTYPLGAPPATKPTVASSATLGGLVAGGVYKFRAVVSLSVGGRIYRSPPSLPTSVTISVGHSSALVSVPPQFTGQRARVSRIEFYRTVNGGDTYYRDKDVAVEPWGTTASYISGGTSDAQLVSNELLYTTGNVLDNYPPPSCKSMAAWGNRLFAISTEFPTRIYFSKTSSDGVGVGFNPALYVEASDAFGKFTALAATDRALIAFKADGVYAITGDGPDNLGNGSFSIQQISTGYGCTDDTSILATPAGLMYRGDNGINLLDRGFACSFVSAPITEYLQTTAIVGACLLPGRSMAAWGANNGHVYVWDWENGQWYRWITPATSCVGMCEHQGAIVVADSSGVVYQEIAGQAWDHVSTPIGMDITFAPITTNGIAGFQRLREIQLVGQRDSDCVVTTTVRYDYLPADTQALVAEISTASGIDRLTRIRVNRQKATAYEVNVKVTFGAFAAGFGYRLSALALEVATKRGLNKSYGSAA